MDVEYTLEGHMRDVGRGVDTPTQLSVSSAMFNGKAGVKLRMKGSDIEVIVDAREVQSSVNHVVSIQSNKNLG